MAAPPKAIEIRIQDDTPDAEEQGQYKFKMPPVVDNRKTIALSALVGFAGLFFLYLWYTCSLDRDVNAAPCFVFGFDIEILALCLAVLLLGAFCFAPQLSFTQPQMMHDSLPITKMLSDAIKLKIQTFGEQAKENK